MRSFGVKDKSILLKELVEAIEVHHIMINWLSSASHCTTLYELGIVEEYDFEIIDDLMPIRMLSDNYLENILELLFKIYLLLFLYDLFGS